MKYFLIMLTYILALLSKEYSLILPALIVLYHFTFKKRHDLRMFLPILGVTFVYIVFRMAISGPLADNIWNITTFCQRLPGFFVAITEYIRIIFLPFNLHMEYGNRLFTFSDPRATAGIIIVLSLGAYALIKRNDKIAFFSIFWFFIALLPLSNLYPLNAYMAEHWLYFPSMGIFLFLSEKLYLAYGIKRLRLAMIFLTLGALTFYSNLTIRQNTYWRDPVTFYERTLRYAPDSARLYNNFGAEYRGMGRNEEAIKLCKKAVQIDSNYASAYYNLGLSYADIGDSENAIAAYKKAIELNPANASCYNELGVEYGILGRRKEAIGMFKRAIKVNPGYSLAHVNLSFAYYHEKQYNLAIGHCDNAISLGYKVDRRFLKLLEPYRK